MLRFEVCLSLAIVLSNVSILAKEVAVYKLPPYVKKACSRNDPKLNECIVEVGNPALKSVVQGDPKYGVPVLDPFLMLELKIKQGTARVGLELICNNCYLHGLENVNFERSDADLKKGTARWDFSVDKLVLKGKYSISGKVLLLPITGQGDCEFDFEKVKMSYIFNMLYVKKSNGFTYINIVNASTHFREEHMVIRLDNLFNGDKVLGENMNIFLNENWKEIMKELRPTISEFLAQVITEVLNKLATRVPYEYMFVE